MALVRNAAKRENGTQLDCPALLLISPLLSHFLHAIFVLPVFILNNYNAANRADWLLRICALNISVITGHCTKTTTITDKKINK